MKISMELVLGIAVTMLALTAIGVMAMKKVKSAADFSVSGRKSISITVAGAILGSIVGGGGTVGTAQAAFAGGLIGWWQTLGLGIGCLVLGVFFANYIYKTQVETIPQVLMKTYGPRIGPVTSLFGCIAIFFSAISQLKSFLPLLTSLFPSLELAYAAIIGIFLVFIYVVFGGLWGASMAGLFKMVMIYISMVVCGLLAFNGLGGFSGMTEKLPASYFDLLAQGPKNIADGVSLCLGVLTTQIYIQALLSAIDAKAARNGSLIAMALTLPLGLFGVVIGMFMKVNFPAVKAAEALPQFFLIHMPPFVAGIFLATLMITTLGSMAGLILGMSTMLTRDIYRTIRKQATDKENLFVMRICIVIICLIAAYFSVSKAAVFIQQFVFLSFALRTCVFLVPLCFAFFYKGQLTPAAGMAAVIVGPAVNIIWTWPKMPPLGIYPVYAGLIAAFIAFLLANALSKKSSSA